MSEPVCVRCGAPYGVGGSCSRRQEGCQGGRGEAGSQYREIRYCCHAGCGAFQAGGAYAGNGWYRVPYGFMSHACPDHAGIWKAFDVVVRIYEENRDTAYELAMVEFEARFDAQYPPRPTTPDYQSSLKPPGAT